MAESYLLRLAALLAQGTGRLPQETRDRHIAYLRAAQNLDGGFSGRAGWSDLYYTAFALRGLAILDGLTPAVCDRAVSFLRASLTQQASVVDFFSLLYATALVQTAAGVDIFAASPPGWDDRVAAMLETMRAPDGGYGKVACSRSGSTYHTFLVSLCYQLLGRPLPDVEKVVQFVHTRRREDGGFVEIAPMKRSGTNPTAAAIGVLQTMERRLDGTMALTSEVHDGVVQFLKDMLSLEGGFRANGRAPLADLLSTFTGLWTLRQLQALREVDKAGALGYVKELECDSGGFRGGLWDEASDVEYTFYGLGCLGVLLLDAE